jgi:hypothetical protein
LPKAKGTEKPKTTRKAGRPPRPKEDILDVLDLISQGLSIRKACDQISMAPRTFMDYIAKPEYSQQYAQAMEKRADALFDQIIDIADVGSGDFMRDRLRVDARKWVVSKMLPKKYGDKIDENAMSNQKLEIIINDRRNR